MPGRRLPQLLDAIKVAGFAGASMTYPFKQDIIPLLDAIDPEAAQVGAINTIAIAAVPAISHRLQLRPPWLAQQLRRRRWERGQRAGKTVVLIGAGGAGRAVAFALMDLGVAAVVLHDLDVSRANRAAGRCFTAITARRAARQPNTCARYRRGSTACRNCHADWHDRVSRQSGPVSPIKATGRPMSSTRRSRPNSSAAAAKGARTLNGSGMCVHQAVEAFTLERH